MDPKIVVVGSCNIDLSCYASRLPKEGETIHGKSFVMGYGGKGANQCVAAAKLGATTSLVGRVGDDTFGKDYLNALIKNNINTDFVNISKETTSGMAQITVADNGANHIVIVAGANNDLSPSDVDKASLIIQAAKVVVFQCETPIETTIHALSLVASGKGISIVNAAPAMKNLDSRIFFYCDIFCVNETEAEIILGECTSTLGERNMVLKLLDMGCKTVIVTLGDQGAMFATQQEREIVHVPVQAVKPVDTTGAGDMFIGALAYYLAYFPQLPLKESIDRACQVATISVLKLGTQSSFPSKEDLPETLFNVASNE